MNLIDQLISDESQEFAAKIRTIFANEQRLLDCEAVCRDINQAAEELKIVFNCVPLVTVFEDAAHIAAHSCSHVTLAQVGEILDSACLHYKLETVANTGYDNEGKAIAFGIEGYVDQLIIRDPKHVDLITASEALERLAA